MKRTFLAVNVSDETRQLIVSLHQELHFSKQYIRFVSPKTAFRNLIIFVVEPAYFRMLIIRGFYGLELQKVRIF